MLMVTFAAFIIVSNQPLPSTSIEEAVLEAMIGRRHRFRYLPDFHFHDCAIVELATTLKQ
ncbi:hypothetical protein N826_25215 [Skermanella aerolata KACC 11604]|nr:hypothetical protein N826_25215 [Skermanella aerolata KACC 11604]